MNRINKTNNIDPMAEARKLKGFAKHSREAEERIRLAEEVYKKRKGLGLSQTELAKRAETTQRIISEIENADLNIGFASLNRIGRVLNFNYKNWVNIFNTNFPAIEVVFANTKTVNNRQNKKEALSSDTSSKIIN